MTGKRPPPIGGRTLADELRDDLARCEDWVIQIGTGTDGLTLLRLLDRIVDRLEQLEARGADLRAERGRLETVLAQLHRQSRTLVTQLGRTLAGQRPAEARWWWYLDEQVAADRRRQLKRVVGGVLVGLSLLIVAYLLYDRFLAPPPHIRRANTLFFQGEQAVAEGNLVRAIKQFEEVVALDPERAKAYLWLGVLYQAAEDNDQAADALEQALALIDSEIDFWLQRGLFYLMLNDIDAAQKDALAAIEEAPNRPEGYILQGNIAEQANDLELAAASFRQAADLAEAAGEVETQALARMRLATILERLMTVPQP